MESKTGRLLGKRGEMKNMLNVVSSGTIPPLTKVMFIIIAKATKKRKTTGDLPTNLRLKRFPSQTQMKTPVTNIRP